MIIGIEGSFRLEMGWQFPTHKDFKLVTFEEAKQLDDDVSRINRNKLIHEAMQRDLRRRELIDKHDAEAESAFDEEFGDND